MGEDQYAVWMEGMFNKLFDSFEMKFRPLLFAPKLRYDQNNFTIMLSRNDQIYREWMQEAYSDFHTEFMSTFSGPEEKVETNFDPLKLEIKLIFPFGKEDDDMDSDNVSSLTCTYLALKVYPIDNDKKLIPTVQTKGSIGADLACAADLTIAPWKFEEVPLGIKLELQEGMYGRLAMRGGYAKRFGLILSGGVIDPDYRGELKAILFNFSDEPFQIKKYDRIVQLIIEKAFHPSIWEVDQPPNQWSSERGSRCMQGGAHKIC